MKLRCAHAVTLVGLCILLLMSPLAYSAYPTVELPAPSVKTSHFYLGGDFGWGRLNLDQGTAIEPTTEVDGVVTNPSTAGNLTRVSRDSLVGLTGGVTVGYQFNRYIGLEFGGDAWEQAEYKWRVYDTTGTQIGNGTGQQRSYDIHLLAKLTYPFDNGFRVFVKGGGAYVRSFTDIGRSLNFFAPLTRRRAESSETSLQPEAAIGLAYQVDEHWSIHGQYVYIWGDSSNPLKGDYIPDLQQATVGVQYDIV